MQTCCRIAPNLVVLFKVRFWHHIFEGPLTDKGVTAELKHDIMAIAPDFLSPDVLKLHKELAAEKEGPPTAGPTPPSAEARATAADGGAPDSRIWMQLSSLKEAWAAESESAAWLLSSLVGCAHCLVVDASLSVISCVRCYLHMSVFEFWAAVKHHQNWIITNTTPVTA